VIDRHIHRRTYTLCLCLSDICLSRTTPYIVSKSRTERPRKSKIGTEVAHVTRDSGTTFKVKGQGHWAALLTAVLASEAAAAMGVRTCWPWETAATLPSAQPREVFRRQWGKRRAVGAYRGGCPPKLVYINSVRGANRLWGESSVGRDVHGAKRPWDERLWGEMSFHRVKCPCGEMSVGRKVHKPAPGPRWGLRPQTPVIGLRSRARHPPPCLIPGSETGSAHANPYLTLTRNYYRVFGGFR